MTIDYSPPWHKASFDRFLQESLPRLLAERLPLTGYRAEPTGRTTCQITVTLDSASGDVVCDFADLPYPDEAGIFEIDGERKVVVPLAPTEELDAVEIACVGEQLYDHVAQRLGQAPQNGLPWDAELARAWLPLEEWIEAFMHDAQSAHRLETELLGSENWLTYHGHLRSIFILERKTAIAPGQLGRVCPFETPEGPNTGRILRVAAGAQIRDGKLVILDDAPQAGLGLSASMIPFLEHDDPIHLLMGANMLRQQIVQSTPEPALVQTGNEPDAPDFWAGRNLLTAFVPWGADTFAEGIVVSESCAQRFDTPYGLEPGDKLANRHGTKGVVSAILPDGKMPHLPDGTSVELAFNVNSTRLRMTHGQVLEAVMGRVAHAEGEPVVVPPFDAPGRDELHQRLAKAGLPESGMETLTVGKGGPALRQPSAVGYVYWGRLVHMARSKVNTNPQRQGDMETGVLLAIGAYENVREGLNTRAARKNNADDLAARLAAGAVEQADPPTPMFADLARRLRIAGIEASLEDETLALRFAPPEGDVIELACPVSHPWLRERELAEIGACTEADDYDTFSTPWYLAERSPLLETYAQMLEANDRLVRMLQSRAPEKLVQDAIAQLQSRVDSFFDALLAPAHLLLGERQRFSARTVIAPGADLRLDQVALADEIAWALFGPLAARELGGDEAAVRARTERAAKALDAAMARSWVIVNRAPTLSPAALIAFHPLREPGSVIRLHPLACEWLNADFDGDQVAVFLPVTEGGQREAGEKLSVAWHVTRDPALLDGLLPPGEALWGLAGLNLTEEGRREIAQLIGAEVVIPEGLLTRATLTGAMHEMLDRDGVEAALAALERLTQRGLEAAKASGASLNPFIGESLQRPPEPEGDDEDAWAAYQETLVESMLARTGYGNPDLGPQLLAIKAGVEGMDHLSALVGPKQCADFDDQRAIVRHGYAEGLTPEEIFAWAVATRKWLLQLVNEMETLAQTARERNAPGTFSVLARARRARHPGIVFARAAAAGEIDPLTDVESRVLVGLPIKT
jgi:hypothetical protein